MTYKVGIELDVATNSLGGEVREKAIKPIDRPTALPNRSAGPAIQGYVYQFDYTILAILKSGDSAVIVEGLEDVDVHGDKGAAAIQVKYLESSHYATPATLRKPIMLMLDALVLGAEYDFILHVHFGDGSQPPVSFTVDDLRVCLTERKRSPAQIIRHYEKYSEDDLQAFTSRLEIRSGLARDDQLKEVIENLASALGCSVEEATELHYGNALARVQDLAMAKNKNDRKTTRRDFLSEINNRKSLYGRWHREVLGQERYVKALGLRIKASQDLGANRVKALEVGVPGDTRQLQELAGLIEYLATTAYGIKRLTSTKVWTIILNGPAESVKELKIDLLSRGIVFEDGYESLAFQSDVFARLPVVNTAGGTITKTSYDIRLMNLESFRSYVGASHQFDVVALTSEADMMLLKQGARLGSVEIFGLSRDQIKKVLEMSR